MFENKIVVITGAAGGIGQVLVTSFLAHGAKVYGIDRNPFPEELANYHHFQEDLTKDDGLRLVFDQIVNREKRIDILINNGAISSFSIPIAACSVEDFRRVINTNLVAAFACSKAFVQAHKAGSYGRIINIASTRFHQNEANWEAYGASKGGLVAFTNSLAVSLANTGITVNAISPGWIETGNYEALSSRDHVQHPAGRVGRPEDVFKGIKYLCDPSNDFVTGHNLIIDGGMTKRMIYDD